MWRAQGHRTAAVMLAALEGVATGQAQNTLANGRRLEQLPGTEAALRAGELSGPKVTELTGAGILAPEREASLLSGADQAPLQAVRERCRRSRATSGPDDPKARIRRIREARHFSSWTDTEGAFCYQGRDTPDRGAQILSHLGSVATGLRRARRAAGDEHTDPERAVRADAFFALVTRRHPDSGAPLPSSSRVPPSSRAGTGAGSGPEPGIPDADAEDTLDGETDVTTTDGKTETGPGPGNHDRWPATARSGLPPRRAPTCSVVVRVDLDALRRGHAEGGECCEIDNPGPSRCPWPGTWPTTRSSVSSSTGPGTSGPSPTWVAPSTPPPDRPRPPGHHVWCPAVGPPTASRSTTSSPWPRADPPRLDNLALLCHHHHFLKTYEDWILSRDGTGPDGRTPVAIRTPAPVRTGTGPRHGHRRGQKQTRRDRKNE